MEWENACLYIKKCPDPWVSTLTVRGVDGR